MLRSAMTMTLAAMIVSWAGLPRDMALREHMVPVKMADGHILQVQPFEVTTDDWAHCVADKVCTYQPRATFAAGRPMPVTGINALDVQQFLAWANARGGGGLRLPTRDEWRWLNRTLEKPKQPPLFTDPRLAWAATYGQEESPGGPVRPSGSFTTTNDGIADLDGNVWEWTSTCAMPGFDGKEARNCPAFFAEGAHEAAIPIFLRNPAAGGCATGTPPTHLGLRLVADE